MPTMTESLKVSETDLGTPEREWLSCSALENVAPFEWERIRGSVVVLAPHPDDETLALGGTLLELSERAIPTSVVAVTDGESSHPPAIISAETLRGWRVDEQTRALAELGLPPAHRLRLRDGKVDARELASHLRPLLAGAGVCCAPYRHDGHPDHDATGAAAATVCSELGITLVEYPIWAWHWASPSRGELPLERARRIDISVPARRRKARAVSMFGSQIRDIAPIGGGRRILPPSVLARFDRPFEVVFG